MSRSIYELPYTYSHIPIHSRTLPYTPIYSHILPYTPIYSHILLDNISATRNALREVVFFNDTKASEIEKEILPSISPKIFSLAIDYSPSLRLPGRRARAVPIFVRPYERSRCPSTRSPTSVRSTLRRSMVIRIIVVLSSRMIICHEAI